MAYDTEKLFRRSVEAIEDNNLIYVQDVCNFTGISVDTYYNHFPTGSEHHNEMIKLLSKNSSVDIVERKKIQTVKTHQNKGAGYVYLIKCGDFDLYKIGVSKSGPNKRIGSIQSDNPFEIHVMGVYYCNHYSLLEHEMHERYREHCVRGEWFRFNEQQLLCVDAELEEQSNRQMKLF